MASATVLFLLQKEEEGGKGECIDMIDLTVKQKKFCEYYALSGNATDAAIKAGYKKTTARVIACENLTKPNIKKYLAELTTKEEEDRIASVDEVLQYLTTTMRNDKVAIKERTRAAELLGKRYGAWSEKSGDSEEEGRSVVEIVFKGATHE